MQDMRDALAAAGNHVAAFITASSRLPVPSRRSDAPASVQVQFLAESTRFIPESSNAASVQECLHRSRFLLVACGCDFHDRGAGRLRHDHHAVIIRADDVARLDGDTPMMIG
ncbi:hypothetical protein [Bradyrhizobium genosp. A]|uniref:hypothetical protein n=1 Tax=Bradyrhizobium genosp. A TaxID=83626 RepID=UPI003CFB4E6A